MARQSQLLRGVFPVLFHPLPAPVWADDVDSRVNFGMEIGERLSVFATFTLFRTVRKVSLRLTVVTREGTGIL